jgi:hypothetical protein
MKNNKANANCSLDSLDSHANLFGVSLVHHLHPLSLRRLASRRRRRSLGGSLGLSPGLGLHSLALPARPPRLGGRSRTQVDPFEIKY